MRRGLKPLRESRSNYNHRIPIDEINCELGSNFERSDLKAALQADANQGLIAVFAILDACAQEILPVPGVIGCPGHIEVEIQVSESSFERETYAELLIESPLIFDSQGRRSLPPVLTGNAREHSYRVLVIGVVSFVVLFFGSNSRGCKQGAHQNERCWPVLA